MENLAESFQMIWLNIGLSWSTIKIHPTPLFFKIDQCSATSIESSRRVLSNDMAEHLSYLEIQSKYILLPYFSRLTNVQPHQLKALAVSFQMIWLNTGLSWKIIEIQPTPLFFKIDQCSATSIESSRRVLSNDMAEHRSILKNNQNTTYFLIFQDWPMFSHINRKLSPSPFKWYG